MEAASLSPICIYRSEHFKSQLIYPALHQTSYCHPMLAQVRFLTVADIMMSLPVQMRQNRSTHTFLFTNRTLSQSNCRLFTKQRKIYSSCSKPSISSFKHSCHFPQALLSQILIIYTALLFQVCARSGCQKIEN